MDTMKTPDATERCRCGYEGIGTHPCHGSGYSCRKPSKQRFYAPRAVGLAGMQLKFQVQDTWACDGCWAPFSRAVESMITDNKIRDFAVFVEVAHLPTSPWPEYMRKAIEQ